MARLVSAYRGRFTRILVTLALVASSSILVAAPPALAINCGNDTWFDKEGWRDNPKIKTGCDTVGTHVHTVQHFNFGAGYNDGGLDGIWGPNTQEGIEDYKEFVCGFTSPSGNVGSDAWECYKLHLLPSGENFSQDFRDIPGIDIGSEVPPNDMYKKIAGLNLDKWWTELACPAPTYKRSDVAHSSSCI